MKDLRGTTAIVTGASRGIGVYIARALAEEGVNLSLTARSADELEQVRTEIESMGVQRHRHGRRRLRSRRIALD